MNFGNFSTVALSAVMVTYAQHPFFLGMARMIASASGVSERSGHWQGSTS